MLYRHHLAFVAALAISTTSGLPTSQITRDVADSTIKVDCGCWNLCTLQQLTDPTTSFNCDTGCDPIFSCESINAPDAVSQEYDVPAPPVYSDGAVTTTDVAKRGIPTTKIHTTRPLPTFTFVKTTLPHVTPIVTPLPGFGVTDPPPPEWNENVQKRDPETARSPMVDSECKCVGGPDCPCEWSESLVMDFAKSKAKTRREADPSLPLQRPHCVCVQAEGCPCSGYETILPTVEKRSVLEGVNGVLNTRDEEDLAKRLAPTGSVEVKCTTQPECSVTVKLSWSF